VLHASAAADLPADATAVSDAAAVCADRPGLSHNQFDLYLTNHYFIRLITRVIS